MNAILEIKRKRPGPRLPQGRAFLTDSLLAPLASTQLHPLFCGRPYVHSCHLSLQGPFSATRAWACIWSAARSISPCSHPPPVPPIFPPTRIPSTTQFGSSSAYPPLGHSMVYRPYPRPRALSVPSPFYLTSARSNVRSHGLVIRWADEQPFICTCSCTCKCSIHLLSDAPSIGLADGSALRQSYARTIPRLAERSGPLLAYCPNGPIVGSPFQGSFPDRSTPSPDCPTLLPTPISPFPRTAGHSIFCSPMHTDKRPNP
jgi:hypothetical protein